jgi:hypothetical protein
MLMWSTCSLLARAGITCYSFHAVCITADRIGLTAAAVQECAQPYLHSGHAPYYKNLTEVISNNRIKSSHNRQLYCCHNRQLYRCHNRQLEV